MSFLHVRLTVICFLTGTPGGIQSLGTKRLFTTNVGLCPNGGGVGVKEVHGSGRRTVGVSGRPGSKSGGTGGMCPLA